MRNLFAIAAAVALLALAAPARAADVVFDDPTGDDNGPGGYTYPTDAVYTRGSFDLVKFELTTKGKKANLAVTVNANLEDPWGMDVGFATQMVFIFIDTDGKEGSGHTAAPPGLNVQFAPDSAWEKCIILSPQPYARVKQEVEAKAGDLAADIVIPTRVRGSGRTISASVDLADLGEGDPATWGYQVLMQSNEGFPADNDLLTRRVNEFEGQHRFGGGSDYMCDPHVMDVLGDQAAMLAYECGPDGSAKKMATLSMVHLGKS
jgi:carbohydrate-binding DOMON domain-containing protein